MVFWTQTLVTKHTISWSNKTLPSFFLPSCLIRLVKLSSSDSCIVTIKQFTVHYVRKKTA